MYWRPLAASPMRGVIKPALAGLALTLSLTLGSSALAQGAVSPDWSATWQASPQEPRPNSPSVAGQTVRQIARVSAGGAFVRVRLSNEFGARPLTIDAAHIALAGQGAAIQPGTDRPLTFATRRSVTIPPGARILSDPVNLAVPPLSDVAVSLYFPQRTGPVTEHVFGLQTGYVAPGNVAAAPNLANATTITHRVVLTGVEVPYNRRGKVVVAFGDTATDGYGSTAGANKRWPDLLAVRLNSRRGAPPVAVVNAGIAGNRLLHDFIGPNALARFDRDVLAQPKVSHVIFLIGINDFGLPGGRKLPEEEVTIQEVAGAFQEMISRARVQGIKVIGATLPPFGPIPDRPGFWSEGSEKKRQQLNQWIRTAGAFDAIIDFEAAVKDPQNPNRLAPQYDSGDHFTPNDAGYAAMAEAIDLKLFN